MPPAVRILPSACDCLRAGSDNHSWSHPTHDVGIAGLADGYDTPAADAYVRLDDSPVVHDHGISDDHIEGSGLRSDRGRLAHAVPQHLAAAESGFVTGRGEVAFDFDEEIGISESNSIAGGRTVQARVLFMRGIFRLMRISSPSNPWDLAASQAAFLLGSCSLEGFAGPLVRLFNPYTSDAPPNATSVTFLSSPGSKRTAVPAGMLSRIPKARARSKRKARLTSKKWK